MAYTPEPIYTAEQVATLLGIRPVTVRYWSRKLSLGQAVTSGNRPHRIYRQADIDTLRQRNRKVGAPISATPSPSTLYRRAKAKTAPKLPS